ncbi:MAG: hypothetical protein LBI45_01180 [Bacteroidales bacterium]|nr:hypothetical protein [Bacteroidales bacterium]
MKKSLFFYLLLSLVSISLLRGQEVNGDKKMTGDKLKESQVPQIFTATPPPLTDEMVYNEPAEPTRGDYSVDFVGGSGTLYSAFGYTLQPGSTYYMSSCISIYPAQVSNLLGGSLHTIKYFAYNTTNLAYVTGFRVWIKNSLDGPVIYEQNVAKSSINALTMNYIPLNTPFSITGAPFVIGITAICSVSVQTTVYLMTFENINQPYPKGASQYHCYSVDGFYGSGATWAGTYQDRALLIGGVVSTGTAIPVNDLAMVKAESYPLKWCALEHSDPYTMLIFNAGSAAQNNYSVEVLDAANTTMGSQTVSLPIAANRFKTHDVNTITPAGTSVTFKGKTVLQGDENPANDFSSPATQKVYYMQPMAYCDNTPIIDGVGTGAANTYSAAIGYTSAIELGPFAAKNLTTVELLLNSMPSTLSNCSVWIRNSLTGADLYSQSFLPVQGWNTIYLNTPFLVPLTGTLYIGYTVTATAAGGYPIGVVFNHQNPLNGGHIKTSATNPWITLGSIGGNVGIIGTVVAATAPVYTITSNANPLAAGYVTGNNVYAAGATVCLTAIPKSEFQFFKWSDDNLDNPRIFTASASDSYTAIFVEKECTHIVSGTGNIPVSGYPVDMFYNNSYSQQLYYPSELGNFTQDIHIKSLSFQHVHSTTITKQNLQVYLANTTKNSFTSGTDWLPGAQLQLVYSGTVTFPANGIVEIIFNQTEDFTYMPGANLCVAFLNHDVDYYTNATNFRATTNPSIFKLIYYRSDYTSINIMSPPSAYAYGLNHTDFTFEFCSISAASIIKKAVITDLNFSCQGVVTVTYNLESNGTEVSLYYSPDKCNWTKATTVSGDVGTVSTGDGKSIIWNNSTDNISFGNFFFKVEYVE